MSTAAVIAVVVVVVVVAAVIAAVTFKNGGAGTGPAGFGPGGMRLKHRFGPEYERALAHHDGDEKATRRELAERVKRYGRLEVRPVPAEDRQRLQAGWDAVQARFVDRPADAVADADRLIGQLAAQRGFPAPHTPEHTDALSVHYPHQLQGYRRAHDLVTRTGDTSAASTASAAPTASATDPVAGSDRAPGSGASAPAADTDGGATEELRRALVAARELFDELLRDGGPSGAAPSREPSPGPSRASSRDADADAEKAGPVSAGVSGAGKDAALSDRSHS
jgi:hypothetical protein